MKLGVVFPQTEIGSDPAVVQQFARAVEEAGFDHLLAYDHVLGAHPDRFDVAAMGRRPPYTDKSQFHEPFVLFGYLAGVTTRLELVTNVLVLPQRQTALVAKQAAEVDVLSRGRLRLGVGIGWNFTEYEALNEDFHTRGRRVAEQVEVMRRLWTEPLVTFDGKYHHLDRIGINPLPVQQPIPVWMGSSLQGASEAVLKRIGRVADGWFPQGALTPETQAMLERVRGYVRDSGRDPAGFGVEARVAVAQGGPEDWTKFAGEWRRAGATHLSIVTMGARFTSPEQHIDAFRRCKQAIEAA